MQWHFRSDLWWHSWKWKCGKWQGFRLVNSPPSTDAIFKISLHLLHLWSIGQKVLLSDFEKIVYKRNYRSKCPEMAKIASFLASYLNCPASIPLIPQIPSIYAISKAISGSRFVSQLEMAFLLDQWVFWTCPLSLMLNWQWMLYRLPLRLIVLYKPCTLNIPTWDWTIHSSVQTVINSILLCTPMLPWSYKKHWCLLNGLPCSYKHGLTSDLFFNHPSKF